MYVFTLHGNIYNKATYILAKKKRKICTIKNEQLNQVKFELSTDV